MGQRLMLLLLLMMMMMTLVVFVPMCLCCRVCTSAKPTLNWN
jgi:hypothetical protein